MSEPTDVIDLVPLGPGTVGTDGILRPPIPAVLIIQPPQPDTTDGTTPAEPS